MADRVRKSILNAKVNLVFYFLSLFFAFFSRKIFLDCLGAEFIGLTGTLGNILSFLNVAELGIGTSITYFLYKPLQEKNIEKINETVSILAYLYRCIGFIIGGVGIAVSLSFPFIFKDPPSSLFLVYFTFYAFLASSVAGYLINFKQLLVSADQKQYLVNSIFMSITLVQTAVQIVLAYYYRNLYLWVIVGFIFTVIGCVLFNWRIDKAYPWLKIDIKRGKLLLKEYPDILRKTRQVFIQKIKNFILYRSDQIIIFAFVSLKMVAFYDNYMILVNKFNVLVNILSDGMNAGIGNLIAEGNKQNTMKVFWELTAIRFIIVGIVIYAFLMFMQPFIVIWLGAEYLLDDIIIYLIAFNIFIMLSRGVVEMYISACGLFSDVWAAWTELALNICITLSLAPFLGIVGILLGKIISVFFIAIFWKPYFLFSKGLNEHIFSYWYGMIKYYIIFAIGLVMSLLLRHYIMNDISNITGTSFTIGIAAYIILLIIYSVLLLIFTKGMKYFAARFNIIHFKPTRKDENNM